MESQKIEILNWLPHWNIILDKKTPLRLRLALVREVHQDCIFALEEILINANHQNLELSDSLVRDLKRHKVILRKLANPKLGVKSKRRLINSLKAFRVLNKVLPPLLKSLQGSQPLFPHHRDE